MGRKAVSYLFFCLSVLFSGALLGAAIFCQRASFISPEEGVFWPTAAMLLPGVLFANLIALIWWLVRRHWLVALIPLAALIVNYGFIASMIQLPGFGGGNEVGELRVATLNSHGFSRMGTRMGSVLAIDRLVAQEQVDVLCMQEFLTDHLVNSDSIATLFSHHLPYFAAGQGQAIASRYPIFNYHYVRFPNTNNDYMQADIKFGDDTVRLFSAHFQTSGISRMQRKMAKNAGADRAVEAVVGELERNSVMRAQQVDQVRAQIDASPYPVLVLGDFNDLPSSYTYRRAKGDLVDGFREAGQGYGGTYRYLGGVLRIDYIFYDKRFEAVDYRICDDDVSDHKMVVAGLRRR